MSPHRSGRHCIDETAWQRTRLLGTTCSLILMLWGAPQTLHAAEVRELVVGPVRLDAHTLGWNHHQPIHNMPVEFANDLWVTGADVHLIDGEGNPLPRQLLCHTTLYDSDIPYGGATMGLTMAPDPSSVRFPKGTGVPLFSGRSYHVLAVFKNTSEHAYPEVYLRLTLIGEPTGDEQPPRQALQLTALCIGGCDNEAMLYSAPPGRSVRQEEAQFPVAGRIVLLTPHLHRYGKRLALEALDGTGRPRLIWQVEPLEDAASPEFSLPSWTPDFAWRVTPNDRFRLTAEYENPTSYDWPAMAALGAFFVPEASPPGQAP